MNEIQFAVTGVRIELLEMATSYGLMRASDPGQTHGPDDWREWVAYIQRLDAWGLGGSESEMAERLAKASRVSDDALDQRIDESHHMDWAARLESLAESARAVEELSRELIRAYPLNEMAATSNPGGVALLGAVEDSLILQAYAEDAQRSLRVSADEIYELLVIARGEDVWAWQQPIGDQYPEPRYSPAGSPTSNFDETVELFKRLIGVSAESTFFYRRLHPDGRELNEGERLEVRQQLVESAVALRQLAQIERPVAESLAAAKPPKELSPVVEGWRRNQRSLVLALSDSSQLRLRAYPADAPMTLEDWHALKVNP